MFQIKSIQVDETYPIRQKVLRPQQSLAACQYKGDEDLSTFHLGVFADGKLISIGSFYREAHPDLREDVQYRLRGMATLEEYRNKKAGSHLIHEAEKLLGQKSANLWWCNARLEAINYYKKLGLKECGALFEIVPIGLHRVMYKKL